MLPSSTTVILLHGLGRSRRAMAPLARRIEEAGFPTINLDYPSTCHPIGRLVEEHVRPVVAEAAARSPVHFVTHSLGGILVRVLAGRSGFPRGSRTVMIAPPNTGSPIADLLHDRWPFTVLCGPALHELGTRTDCIPPQLGPVGGEVGVIAGDRAIYPWFHPLLDGPSDGLVSVEGTKVNGMADFVVVRAGHAFIMRHPRVATETIHFLRHGAFSPRRGRNEGVG